MCESSKQKTMLDRGPSRVNLGIRVWSFEVYQASVLFSSIAITEVQTQ